MRAGHGKNVRGAFDERSSERFAPEILNIDAFLFANFHGVEAGRLTAHGVHAGGRDLNILAVAKQTPEKPFRDRAATNISGADKKDAFHDD